jgi:hypothetical protein
VVQEVEKLHQAEEKRIYEVKEAGRRVLDLGVSSPTRVEVSGRVEAAIVSYNTVCADLLGKHTEN